MEMEMDRALTHKTEVNGKASPNLEQTENHLEKNYRTGSEERRVGMAAVGRSE